jgi:hypothetical protein
MKKCPRFVGVVDLDAHDLPEAVVRVDQDRRGFLIVFAHTARRIVTSYRRKRAQ